MSQALLAAAALLLPIHEPELLPGYRVGEDQSAGRASIEEILQSITRPNSAPVKTGETQTEAMFCGLLPDGEPPIRALIRTPDVAARPRAATAGPPDPNDHG